MEVGEDGEIIKMRSDESHFNVSVGTDGQSHKTVSTNHNLFEEKLRAEAVSNRGPSAYQPNALPLGQTCSQSVPSLPPIHENHTIISGVNVRCF